jgi:hypothetical protein
MFELWFALLGGGSFIFLDVGPSIGCFGFIFDWQGFIIILVGDLPRKH